MTESFVMWCMHAWQMRRGVHPSCSAQIWTFASSGSQAAARCQPNLCQLSCLLLCKLHSTYRCSDMCQKASNSQRRKRQVLMQLCQKGNRWALVQHSATGTRSKGSCCTGVKVFKQTYCTCRGCIHSANASMRGIYLPIIFLRVTFVVYLHVWKVVFLSPSSAALNCLKTSYLRSEVWSKLVLLRSYLMTLKAITDCITRIKGLMVFEQVWLAVWLTSFLSALRSPRLIDMGKVYRQTNVENLEQAFTVAERDLGVTRLLDPEGKSAQKWL